MMWVGKVTIFIWVIKCEVTLVFLERGIWLRVWEGTSEFLSKPGALITCHYDDDDDVLDRAFHDLLYLINFFYFFSVRGGLTSIRSEFSLFFP